MSNKLATEIKKLSLHKGDILVIERGFGSALWQEALRDAGRTAGIDFDVPVVYVDDIDKIAVVRMGQNG